MGRGGGLLGAILRDLARASRRAKAQQARNQRAYERQMARQEREDARWEKLQEKEENKQYLADCVEEVEYLNKEATAALQEIEEVLLFGIKKKIHIEWEKLKDNTKFSKPLPSKPEYSEPPNEPNNKDKTFRPRFNIFDFFIPSLKDKIIQSKRVEFLEAQDKWKRTVLEIEKENRSLEENYEKAVKKWEVEKSNYYKKQNQQKAQIDSLKDKYNLKEPDAIEAYCSLVLEQSEYPEKFPQEFELQFNPENGILILNYSLPSIEMLPRIKEVKYIKAKDENKEYFLSDTQIANMFDSVIYKIALRTLHELFDADIIKAINSIVFNGWVNSIDKSIGKYINVCIMSVQASRIEFFGIDLKNVGPKECFKRLKGVSSAKLSGLSSIRPILQLNKEDKRFIDHYEVMRSIESSTNIAAMHWEDFEHLIRELFEKEFMFTGGEVKITRGSSDGGVDAVAFDPDPIRGGKIVIQAKRYTNTVGVSAVRDLFGTVMNEGANKGILVTTADYGPDAYDFAKDKPITLLNGSNLLHMLEKHGYKAKIDIKEAKRILMEEEKK